MERNIKSISTVEITGDTSEMKKLLELVKESGFHVSGTITQTLLQYEGDEYKGKKVITGNFAINEDKKKVYVVTAGHYSDYRVLGIFSTMEKAEEYHRYCPCFDIRPIKEWPLDGEPDRSYKLFDVRADWESGDCRITDSDPLEQYSFLKDLVKYYGSELTLYIAATTRDRAIKIAADRIRQIKAEEHFRYPLLRKRCSYREKDGRSHEDYPLYDYHTGEIALWEGQAMTGYTIPADLEHTVKFREIKE